MRLTRKLKLLVSLLMALVVIMILLLLAVISQNKDIEEIPVETADAIGVEDSSGDGADAAAEETGDSEPEDQSVEMIFAGDIYPDEDVLAAYDASGIDGILSEEFQSIMNQADITIVNEEFPFGTTGTAETDKQYTFRVDPSYITMFQEMGIDGVTLANNHTLDYGDQAIEETFALLDSVDIKYTGAGDTIDRSKELIIYEVNGKTIGFLAASRVIPKASWNVENHQPGVFCTYDETALCQAIEEAEEVCDFTVVYVHWGVERATTPEDYERTLAQAYVDAGADLVIGSHPHVLQGFEYYNGVPIIYSMGNYIFHDTISSTMLIRAVIDEEDQLTVQVIPGYASGAKTQEMSEEDGAALYEYLEGISYDVSLDEDGIWEEP